MSDLKNLCNIGENIEKALIEAGITSAEELKELGAKEAFLRLIRINNTSGCLSKLNALQGAVDGVRWHDLPDEVKRDLKNFYNNLKD